MLLTTYLKSALLYDFLLLCNHRDFTPLSLEFGGTQAMIIQIWLQNKLSLIPFEVRFVDPPYAK